MELAFLQPAPDQDPEIGITPRKLQDLIPYQPRPYASLELEPTTRCSLFCPSCPRTVHWRSWIEQDMSMEVFERIAPAFRLFETIHFRGWGEPLLHPYFPDMVRMAYQSGSRLVLTSNGAQMPELGVLPYFDTIFFRLDVGRASTYERRNPHAQFNRTLFNISRVLHWRDQIPSSGPNIVVLFMKNRYTLSELPSYLETALRLQPDRVVFYQPVFHVRKIDAEAELPKDTDPGLIRHVDGKLAAMAESAGLNMINPKPPKSPGEAVCCFDPDRSIFVNWSGRITLCRHSAVPVATGEYNRHQGSRSLHIRTRFFGYLDRTPLETILNTREFHRFKKLCLRKTGRLAKNNRTCSPQLHPLKTKPEKKGNLVYLNQATG